ncbi:hypothetical protein ADL28_25365 [Streptomyces violaceusniger]|uniref:Uncharacterized protein n=2 Tax=Streptomyces TaxID=1883 RepID=A0A0X3W257_STRVO|nr:hypothetical protein ADL28_25365 [Streptomyces violaceusniger]
MEGDLLVVAGRERVLAGPGEDGLDEALVRLAVERELRLDQPVGVVQDGVGTGVHGGPRCWGVFARVVGGHRWV